MQALIERDYFSDYEILKEPYAFFDALREHGPIYQPPGKDYYVVTGFTEALEVLRNHEDFTSIIALQGAGAPLPFTPQGGDINAEVDAHRQAFPGWDQVISMDDERHALLRALINTLFVPSRLKASEAFITDYCDDMVAKAVAAGKVELITQIATPYVTVVVADLLGVPVEDRQVFMDAISHAPPPGNLDGGNPMEGENHPFAVMGKYFYGYIAERRADPRDDILSELAHATYSNGTTPEVFDIVQLGMFMFGAGQDTSAKLLGNSMKYLVERPELQDELRADPSRIPAFIEEVLRLEGSTKQTARLARRDTRVGGMDLPAGSRVLVALSAANRDPARWDEPNALVLGRKKIIEHVGFGRGKHVCAGAPLARVEVRVMLEKLLAATSRITLDPARHPGGIADLSFEPSFIIRGLTELYLVLEPAHATSKATAESTTEAAAA